MGICLGMDDVEGRAAEEEEAYPRESEDAPPPLRPIVSPPNIGSGLVGLNNLGNTCFMNSALQCLSHTPPLRDYFLNQSWRRDLNKSNPLGRNGRMARAYAELMKSIWQGDSSCVSPSSVKTCISKYAPQFSGYSQQDSQEVTAFILDGLHEDLNRTPTRKYEEESYPERLNLEELALLSWRNHLLRNKSIVVDIFQGQLKTTLQCLTCHRVVTKFDPFMFLSLPIDQSRAQCSLADCLRLFTREQKLTGSNQWYCPQCRTHRAATLKYDLYRLPPLLIVHLVRFRSVSQYRSSKLDQFVDYPLNDLDLSPFLQDKSLHQYSTVYSLYAVSLHSGNLSGGHYTAACRDPEVEPPQWYYFNDSIVSRTTAQSVVSSAAYLLFYTMMLPERTGNSARKSSSDASEAAPAAMPDVSSPMRHHVVAPDGGSAGFVAGESRETHAKSCRSDESMSEVV